MPFNRLNHNALGEIRPRFRLKTSLEEERVFDLVKEQIKSDATVSGSVVMKYAILQIPKQMRHFWSPELQIRIEFHEFGPPPEDTIIRCLIGPNQSVWGLFVFFYAAVGLLTLFGSSYGFIQMSLGKESLFVWLLPLGLLLLPTIWLIAKVGQKTGRDQMLHLVSFLYHTLAEHGELERVE